jgi:hypothetical protein
MSYLLPNPITLKVQQIEMLQIRGLNKRQIQAVTFILKQHAKVCI